MKKYLLKSLARKHIICFLLFFNIVDQILLHIRKWGVDRLSLTDSTLERCRIETVFNIIFGIIFLFFTYLLGEIKNIGLYSKKGFWRGLLLGLPMLFLIFFYILGYYNIRSYHMHSVEMSEFFIVILHVLSVSFLEEIAFRAVLYLGLLKHGSQKKNNIVVAVIISSVIFGIGHISNGFENRIQAILFVMNAAILGLFWSSIFINVKNIWSVIFLHAFADFIITLPYVIFPGQYAQYMAGGAIASINKLLGTSLVSADGTVQYIVLNFFCIPILVASIVYMWRFKKDERGGYGST